MATTETVPAGETPATTPPPAKPGFFADVLHPERVGSSHRTEFIAGLTTFVTMAYIIFVNTSIMEAAGLNPTALVIGTIFSAVVPTIFMGLWADKPWALAPGLGYNALFAFTVVSQRHFPVGAALALVFLDGLAFLLLVSGPWRAHHQRDSDADQAGCWRGHRSLHRVHRLRQFWHRQPADQRRWLTRAGQPL